MISEKELLGKKRKELLKFLLAEEGVSPSQATKIKPREVHGPLPLSFAQERLWFLAQLDPDSAAYNMSIAVRLRGGLDVSVLERSFQEMVRRHEVLRTTFCIEDGESVQKIAAKWNLPFTLDDLCAMKNSERWKRVNQLITEEGERAFDLSNGPLIRMKLLQVGSQEYVLVVTMHHIVTDGWSMNVFIQELTKLYEVFRHGETPSLPPLPIQYADFAVWQRQWLSGEVLEQQLRYWRELLDGAPTVLSLPTARPRPAVQRFLGASYMLDIPSELLSQLHTLRRKEGVTFFMLLLAAFEILLSRYSGQDDFCVGTPIANRTRLETEKLIGFFVNTLVIRADLSGRPSVAELLRRVRTRVIGAQGHQDLPFEKLVEVLQPERNLSHSPLFQVMFSLENAPSKTEESLEGLTISPIESCRDTATFDLTLAVIEDGETVTSLFEYNTDLFDGATIERMAAQYRMVLEGMVVDPEACVADLSFLTEAEQNHLLINWNATEHEWGHAGETVIELFEAQVDRTPTAVAVVFHDEAITYADLNHRTDEVAHSLQNLGVSPETLIGLYVERSLEMVVGLLGILKAGGAYVPLDPSYPRARIVYILEDAAVSVLLTQRELVDTLPKCRATVLCLDQGELPTVSEKVREVRRAVKSGALAYVIYTSGSTGRPKGVMISHENVFNFLAAMRERLKLTGQDCLLAATSFAFDISLLELFLPLTLGARVVLADTETAHDGLLLLEAVDCNEVSIMQATPATWRMLVDGGWKGKPGMKVLCGGEALTIELARELLKREVGLWNLYGPTETTVWSTMYEVTDAAQTIPVGYPIANTQLYVLDGDLQPVPVGVPGALYIGGMGLARGYWQQAALTAEKFIPHPFTQSPGARLYKTGDVGCYRIDGAIEFLGRRDHQVKLRGYRIELGEIETHLRREACIQEAVVVVREDRPGDKRLVGYVMGGSDMEIDLDAVKAGLRERVPAYMMPSGIVALEALPLTANGKVDRTALPALEGSGLLTPEYVAPRTPTEERLAAIWAEELNVPLVGVHDNFFDLGGHSLLAVRLVARVRNECQVKLNLIDLFFTMTVAELSVRVEKAEKSLNESDAEWMTELLDTLEK